MLRCGDHDLPPSDPNGECGKYSFLCLENGYMLPTNEIELVRRAQNGKMSVNLQIKLWSEDVGMLLMPNELKNYCKDMPKWVYEAVIKQTEKRYMNEIGFIPSFLR